MGRRTAAAGDSAPAGDAPPIFFLRHQKENAPRPVEKKTCSAGRPAQAQPSCRRRGKVGSPLRQSETETRRPWGNLQPGEVQGYPLPLSPLPLTLPRRSRQRLAKRKARKEKLVECILAPRRCRHHPPRDSSHDLAEDDSVPEGKPKSALVPIRRPRQHRGANAPACAKSGLFFWTGCGPFSFRQDRKENGGRIAQPSSWLNPPGRQIAAPAAPPEESPLSGGGEAKKRRPALRPAAPRSVFMPKIP